MLRGCDRESLNVLLNNDKLSGRFAVISIWWRRWKKKEISENTGKLSTYNDLHFNIANINSFSISEYNITYKKHHNTTIIEPEIPINTHKT